MSPTTARTYTVIRTRMIWDADTLTWSYPTETLTTVATIDTVDELLRRYPGETAAYPNCPHCGEPVPATSQTAHMVTRHPA